ncbi:hypothetical protein QBC33DRAFT_350113 [Phialemonium atrogriseum]|uniref:RRM domain-containing protein n=1 Tax=Phialemonium atrogriseum TaxID=1093897 RepID=A0AAJ0C3K6_9PEZI|nr:uncharacterized protein QBC33DRAFT_350113 [Phialemonium atrogriseum]KAK1769291.1 hypothetical protein QBC33DRAFT_350113 [Phialemonium atrogriseum]
MAKSATKKRQRETEDFSEAPNQDDTRPKVPPPKKARVESSRTLFVRSLPPSATDESLTEFFSQHYPVKHAVVVLDPKTRTSRGYGFVTFTDEDDTIEAKEKLGKELLDGRRIRLDIAEPRQRDSIKGASSTIYSKVAEEKRKREEAVAEAKKPPKLIIRNLPWSIKTSAQLSALFRSYGKVKFSDLPNAKGKLSGFGFVTLRGRKNAENAMEGLNGKVVDGRTLAVDWAVDKETWQKTHEPTEVEPTEAEPKEADSELEDVDSKSTQKAKKPKVDADGDEPMTQEDADIANFMKNHMENLEDESDGSDDEERGSQDDEKADEEGDASEDGNEKKKEAPRITDNSTTLFIRNLPYTTTEEELKAHFTQFGPVRYARVVKDRLTDRPAGTGFVCLFSVDDFKDCLRNSPRRQPATTLGKPSILQDESVDEDGRYTMQGRVLQVAQAVNKDEATRLASDGPGARKHEDKDKRRLYLLSEGTIAKNSALYDLLAPSEIKLRETSEKQRKKMIQSNPSLHLSLTRLAIRNIPREVTAKDLKALARQAVVGFAKDVKEGRRQPLSKEEVARGGQQDRDAEQHRKEKGKGVVRQAKIVFETKEGSKVSEDGGGKSRGYGFIEYSSHRWALMGLRWLNGHPLITDAGKTLRLVVEFAIENANVVQRRKALQERSSRRPEQDNSATQRGPGAGPSYNSRPRAKAWGPKGRGKEKKEQTKVEEKAPAGPPGKAPDEELAMRTRIIARKRSLRKKKAIVRGK